MKLDKCKTPNGFQYVGFTDQYGHDCALQESSLATESAIWFGINHPNPVVHVPGSGWQSYPLPPNVHISTRMHLTQYQVQKLLPALQYFAEYGELPE